LTDLMGRVIGAPLPPIWEKNRSKYYQIFKPILDDKEAYDRLMNSPAGADLKKWARDYAHKRARELGITFGSPGADNPDDNDNIGEALLALPPQERGLFLAAAERGDAFVMDFILSRDRDAFPGPFDPETLGAYRSASLSGETAEFSAPFSREQKDAVMEIYREILKTLARTPRVAILSSGYARGAAALMGGAEPAALLRPEEAPRALADFRLLIIPSGSLSDWYLSESLKAAIDEFVSSGGTVLAFSQQLGKEYSVLPGNVNALGFAEDQSCQYASARISSGAGAFCSMNTPTPDFNVDGYFLDYPLESEVWLTRTKNDQPCMISYPYGEGRVVLSTLYMDWAAGNHQGTAHERLFFRDLTAFLLSDAPVLRADSGRITVDVPAPDDGEGRGVFTPLLIGPDGEEIALPEGAAAGGAVNLPQGSAPGFYRLGGVFTDPSGKIAGRALPGIRFALSALPESLSAGGGVGGGISASAASDLENYIRGAEAKFSILLWNRGSEAKRVRVDWRFPHNIQAAGADRGKYQGSSTVVVGPGARETLPVTITVVNTDGIDRLWANAYDDATGEQLAAFSKGFYTKNPSTEVKMVFPSEGASPGKPVGGTVYFKNPFGARGTCTLRLKATDPAGKIVESERAFEAGEGEVSAPFELALPEDAFSGECVALAFISLKGSTIGVGSGRVFYTGETKPLKGRVIDRITGNPVTGCEV
ncbi:MAG: hypothetical protein GX310_10830, partial [Synergistaceae bacterium]|nr:hypothetical protein [Synergistaceae bacterium]